MKRTALFAGRILLLLLAVALTAVLVPAQQASASTAKPAPVKPAPVKPAPVKPAPVELTTRTVDYTYGTSRSPLTNLVATWNDAAKPSTLPWIVIVHGGTWSAGDNVVNESVAAKMFASHGFATFNIDYRLVPDVSGATQEQDVLRAVQYVRAHWGTFKIDPNKGTLYGFSAGGQLATLIGYKYPGLVQDIVVASGVTQPQRLADNALGMRPVTEPPTSWFSYGLARMNQWTGCAYLTVGMTPACAAAWRAFEPQTYLTARSAPTFVLSGSLDPIVRPAMSQAFGYWLTSAHVENRVVIAAGYGHDEREMTAVTANAQAVLKWMVAHVHAGTW